jgi:RND family efflux transporter MFP subunit
MDDKSALLNQLRIDRNDDPGADDRRWPWIVGAAALIALALVAAWLLLRPRGIPVRAVTVAPIAADTPGQGASLLDASGYVVARREATVSSKITGKVVAVLIEEGQHVKAGEIVARLDDTNVRADFDQARAQLDYAKARVAEVGVNLANAERDYARKRDLFAQNFISRADLDTAQTTLDDLRAQRVTAQRNQEVAARGVEVAQRNLDDTIVRAPFDGVITVKAAQPGEIVSPFSAGGGFTRTGIGTIVDMNSLEVEVDVNENFINRVRDDQPATVRLNAYPDWSIPAHVIAIIPTADRSKATVKVRVGFDTRDQRILPEMGARVAFLSEPAQGGTRSGTQAATRGVLVPAEAVQVERDTGTVFVIHDGTVERRIVKIGARTADGVTVVSGLSGDERLAEGDFSKLDDGAAIRIEH